MEMTLEQKKALAIASARKRAMEQQASAEQPVYSGAILPFSRYEDGSVKFDPNAGIVGPIKRAVTLPGEVMRGEVDLNSEEAIRRSLEAAAIMSPMTPPMRNIMGPGVVTRSRQVKPKPPTAQELKAAAKPVYEQIDRAGTEFSTQSIDDLSTAIQNELIQKKFIGPDDAPKTFRKLGRLQNAPEGATVPYSTGINAARKQLGRQGAKPDLANPDDPRAASYAARRIMEWFEGGADDGVVAGPNVPANLLKEANKNYAAAKRSETLTGLLDDAELRAAAANSGKNLGNATRQRIAGLLINKGTAKDRVGFTPGELAALEQNVVQGTTPANVTRDLGNVLGGGGGLGQLLASTIGGTAGYAGGGPVGGAAGILLPAAVGRGSKALSNALTKRALSKVDQATRMRSPLYNELMRTAPMETMTIDARQALIKALLAKAIRYRQEPVNTAYDPFVI